ncbi:MAG TPA: hypothetical protein VHC20_02290 [Candidatus Paceibacterota bacterium]|nr:hypothetical protein [Candidatus Paceibacterota bacterium]
MKRLTIAGMACALLFSAPACAQGIQLVPAKLGVDGRVMCHDSSDSRFGYLAAQDIAPTIHGPHDEQGVDKDVDHGHCQTTVGEYLMTGAYEFLGDQSKDPRSVPLVVEVITTTKAHHRKYGYVIIPPEPKTNFADNN